LAGRGSIGVDDQWKPRAVGRNSASTHGLAVHGKDTSMVVCSSQKVGSRQSQWPPKHGGVFKVAMKSVCTVPSAAYAPPVLQVYVLSTSCGFDGFGTPSELVFRSQWSAVRLSHTVPFPISMNRVGPQFASSFRQRDAYFARHLEKAVSKLGKPRKFAPRLFCWQPLYLPAAFQRSPWHLFGDGGAALAGVAKAKPTSRSRIFRCKVRRIICAA
jgi:hypothetical protein